MSKKILIIDDEPDLVKMVAMGLTSHGYEVSTACDGWEGLQQVEAIKPDLILLDILMPRIGGCTFLDELKNRYGESTMPVVVQTAKPDMEDVFRSEGVKDYLLKPYKVEDLLAVVKKYFP